ncbi:MAG: MBL fold metallo-hydrolase [Planctomycetaceae bacterium]
MKLTFLGAAGEVTGSQHLIETDRLRLLLDCGLFQGRRAEANLKNRTFFCTPKTLDGVVLSHAHIDHCGNLPGLYKAGYRGPIFCTEATAEIAEIMLEDSAGIQQEDARYLQKHATPGGPSTEPLYTEADVRGCCKLFEPIGYHEWHELSPDLKVRLHDAGHILGSAIVELDVRDGTNRKRLVFTGDLGRRHTPLLRDPEFVESCDALISESTYGDRIHPPVEDIKKELVRIFKEAHVLGGRVIIPAFSLGRTQHILYFLNELVNSGQLPRIPIFVDSPLSKKLTNVFRRYAHIMDVEAQEVRRSDVDLFGFPGLVFLGSQAESAQLNHRKGAFVVIAASGMCENGRVRHHLMHAVGDENNTIVIIGFQAQHTLGRRLVERRPRVRIFDRDFAVRAKIEILNGLSAHADANDFRWWFEHLSKEGGADHTFLVHGEPKSSQSLAAVIHDYCNSDPIIPERMQSFEV